MIPVVLFLLSIGLQLAASVYAILLIRITGRKLAWILLSVAMLLMGWGRIVSFVTLFAAGKTISFDFPEYIALIISALMLVGVLRLRTYFISIHIAIEKQKQTENELRESEERYRTLYTGTPIMMHSIDAEGKLVSVSDHWLQTLGYTRDEVIGRRSSEFLTEQSRVYAKEVVLPEFMRTGICTNIEYQFVKKNGDIIDTLLSAITERDPSGLFVRSLAVIVDITKRKLAEEKLKESEERFRSIFDHANDGILIADLESKKFVIGNQMICRMLGYDSQEILNLSVMDIHPEKDLPNVIQHFERQAKREMREAKDLPVKRKDGSIFYADINSSPLKIGNKSYLVGIFRDVTEYRRLEEQLRQSQKMEGIGTLAGGIAHDFNNILSAIVGYGHIALMGMDEKDPQKKNIEGILEASDRAATLIKDLLLFGRKQSSVLKAVDLNEVIKTVEKFIKRVIGEDIQIRTDLQNWPITVLADSHQIEQLFMNLTTNARDAMPKGGTFSINTEEVLLDKEFCTAHAIGKPGRYALISISDTGSGMDKETIKRMYEPFFTTKEVGKGTGLGLAVVYGIVKQHEGYIDAYSEVGIGTTFKIYLPVTESVPAEQKPSDIKEKPRFGTETVLIAEDEEMVRNLVEGILTKHGYTVIVSIDGEDAVNKFKENKEKIQLLFFDLVMPKMNGVDAYDEIRKIRPDIKAIFASGYSPDIVRQKVVIDKDAVLIYKPVSPFYMLRKIREVLDNLKSSSVEIP